MPIDTLVILRHVEPKQRRSTMRRINPITLRVARSQKGLSLDKLADRSRIDKQTIYRIESGKLKRNGNTVIEKLSRALGVTEEELCSSEIATTSELGTEEVDQLLRSSQLNLRVSDRARNALSLTAARYKVSLSQIVEIAPLLFCWAAEQSLQQRQKVIDDIKQKNVDLASVEQSHLHPTGFMFHNRSEAIFDAEQKSVNANDIFAKLVDGNSYESYLPDDYDEAKNNPFANYLRKLTVNLKDANVLEGCEIFEEWDPDGSPNYSVCQSTALIYVANDTEAAERILEGYVPLHKIPKELREKNKAEERAKWIREDASDRSSKLDIELDL
jgi:transcriptional regulator with XRE-family HTH domain